METELAGQIDEGEQMRITAAAKVPEDMLKSYEQIRRRKKGLTPVCAELNDELKCGSCHLKNNAESRISVTKGKVVLCDNCGSILYLPGTV
jgi:predicted  nucleic acid-binding Zn-ribbon protein